MELDINDVMDSFLVGVMMWKWLSCFTWSQRVLVSASELVRSSSLAFSCKRPGIDKSWGVVSWWRGKIVEVDMASF